MCFGSMICQCHFQGAAYSNNQNNLYNAMLSQGAYGNMQTNQGLGQLDKRSYQGLSYEVLKKTLEQFDVKVPKKLVLDPNSTNRKMNNLPRITAETYVGVSATSGAVVSVDKDLTVVKREAAQIAHKEEGAVIVLKPVFQVEPKRDVVETEITL